MHPSQTNKHVLILSKFLQSLLIHPHLTQLTHTSFLNSRIRLQLLEVFLFSRRSPTHMSFLIIPKFLYPALTDAYIPILPNLRIPNSHIFSKFTLASPIHTPSALTWIFDFPQIDLIYIHPHPSQLIDTFLTHTYFPNSRSLFQLTHPSSIHTFPSNSRMSQQLTHSSLTHALSPTHTHLKVCVKEIFKNIVTLGEGIL